MPVPDTAKPDGSEVSVDKGGWLDQLLLAVLGFLNQPWLSIGVALVGGAAVAYLGRVSPKNDWEYISEWPGRVLLGAFVVLANIKSVPRLVFPAWHFVCDKVPGEFGIPVSTDCHWESEGTIHTVQDYTFGDWAHDFFGSLVQDAILGLVGAGVGFLIGTIVVRSRRAASRP